MTFNRTQPDLRHNENWHVLQLEPKLKEILKNLLLATFKRIKNLCDFFGDKKICNNTKLICAKTVGIGKCHPCLARTS